MSMGSEEVRYNKDRFPYNYGVGSKGVVLAIRALGKVVADCLLNDRPKCMSCLIFILVVPNLDA